MFPGLGLSPDDSSESSSVSEPLFLFVPLAGMASLAGL